MKKLLFTLIIVFLTLIIYTMYANKKVYYFSICNKKYDKLLQNKVDYYYNYYQKDIRINDIVNIIDDNLKIDDRNIKNILIKSNIIVIDSTTNELYNKKLSYKYINNYLINIDNLLKIIRLYSKEQIYVLGISNVNNSLSDTNYYNNKLKSILLKYNMNYIDVTKGKIDENIYKTVDF